MQVPRHIRSVTVLAGLGTMAALSGSVIAAEPPAAPAMQQSATTQPATQTASAAGEVVAIDQKMSLWWISPASKYRIEGNELVVENPTAQAAAFAGFIGGPAWENHHVSLEFLLERNTSPKQPRPGAYDWNIQIAPHNSGEFFQIMGRACNICCFTPEVNNGEFTHISDKPAPPVAPGRWYQLDVISQDGGITMALDRKVMNQAQLPTDTRGMLGLIVNFASDAVVRIRNMRVVLTDPDAEQLAQSLRNAKSNWDAEMDRLSKEGKPLPKPPW